MKSLKLFWTSALVATLVFLGGSAVSFADEHGKEEIQSLQDAAAALKISNPDLSDRLGKYADKEAGEKGEAEEKGEGGENREANMKLLQDSAKALEASNPQLAGALTKYAAKEAEEAKEGSK